METEQEKLQRKEQKKSKIRCSKCGSLFGYLRLKDRKWQCRSCGNSETLEEKK